MKPPVQFLNLKDQQKITAKDATSTYAILDPAITIERCNEKLEVAARFNVEVKPYPIFSRGDNKDWPHARYTDIVRLTYSIVDDEVVTYEPDTSIEDAYTLTQTISASDTLGLGTGVSGPTPVFPTANFSVSIVRGGQVQVESKASPWICNAGREPLTTAHPKPRFSWEWISNLGENPVIPDTAFRGKKWPVAIRRCIHETALDLPQKEDRRTKQHMNSARKAVADILHFSFSIEIVTRELGAGGLRAHREKWIHHLRPFQQPKKAYNPQTNRGVPLKIHGPESFCLSPRSVDDFTEEDLESIVTSLDSSKLDTDSLQDAKKRVHREFAETGMFATHISTYTQGTVKMPRVVDVAEETQGPEGEKITAIEVLETPVEGKTKATFVAKNWT